jgi:hypothetical protein
MTTLPTSFVIVFRTSRDAAQAFATQLTDEERARTLAADVDGGTALIIGGAGTRALSDELTRRFMGCRVLYFDGQGTGPLTDAARLARESVEVQAKLEMQRAEVQRQARAAFDAKRRGE